METTNTALTADQGYTILAHRPLYRILGQAALAERDYQVYRYAVDEEARKWEYHATSSAYRHAALFIACDLLGINIDTTAGIPVRQWINKYVDELGAKWATDDKAKQEVAA
jgi:hypothetical protein